MHNVASRNTVLQIPFDLTVCMMDVQLDSFSTKVES